MSEQDPRNDAPDRRPDEVGRSMDDRSWTLLEKTLLAGVQEQKRSRRWGIFFKLLTFLYITVAVLLVLAGSQGSGAPSDTEPHTALIEVKGVIADDEQASADHLVTSLREAFGNPAVRGVILRINSPGGSPVQAGYVYDEIKRLRGLHPAIKVYAVITDLGASGAYYIASAADEIYADKASLVGSIGVTAATFGFVDTMKKLGVERRVYTSGEHKTFLDPFQPAKDDERAFWQGVLDTTHQQFIDAVRKGRGERLKDKDHPELFSGLVWSGQQAQALGLVDGLGSASQVAREVIGEKTLVDYTFEEPALNRLAKSLGVGVAQQLALYLGWQGPTLR